MIFFSRWLPLMAFAWTLTNLAAIWLTLVFVISLWSRFTFFFFDARSQFESHDGSSDSTLSPYTDSPTSSCHVPMSSPNYSTASSYSPCQNQNYPPQSAMVQPLYHNPHGSYKQYERAGGILAGTNLSPELTSPTNVTHGVHERSIATTGERTIAANTNQSESSPQLSPVFKSEAAKQIIKEMTEKRTEGPRRRQIPREKRRHYTVSSSKPVLDLEDTFSKMVLFVFIQFPFFLFLSLSFSLSFSLSLSLSLSLFVFLLFPSCLRLVCDLYLILIFIFVAWFIMRLRTLWHYRLVIDYTWWGFRFSGHG